MPRAVTSHSRHARCLRLALVRLRADRMILAKLACALARERVLPLAA